MTSSTPTRPPDFRMENLDHAEPARIWKARCFIHEHLGEELSLTRVADFVNISPNYLSEEFKRVTGSQICRLHCPNEGREGVRTSQHFESADQRNRV